MTPSGQPTPAIAASATISPITGAALLGALREAGVRFVASVPDRVTSETVLRPLAAQNELRLVRVCKEDEGVSICSALFDCGIRSVLLMQHTGLMDSLNMLQWTATYKIPVVMLVGLLGHESGVPPAESSKAQLRAIPAVLDAIGVDHSFLHAAGDEAKIAAAYAQAEARSRPFAMLLGRTPA